MKRSVYESKYCGLGKCIPEKKVHKKKDIVEVDMQSGEVQIINDLIRCKLGEF